jgi:tetratricopeptide (TPR) repeat protein
MIDVDRMESQLQSALKGRRRTSKPVRAVKGRMVPPIPRPALAVAPPRLAAPAIAPALAAASARVLARLRVPVAVPESTDPAGRSAAPPRPRSRLVELLDDGELVEADRLMADVPSRRESVSWATMRALFVGCQDTARDQNRAMHALAQENRDREAMDRYWLQRFWLVAAWGTDDERQELVERCRDRAYRADDLAWTAALAVLLAQMGKADEAGEAFEEAFGRLGRAEESIQLDVATNLVEAAALLRDAFLAGRLHHTLVWTPGRLVTVGEGWICKGAIERYRALGEAAVGMFAEADEDFRRAVARHRALGAEPLLAQTLHQWGTTLVGRDDVRAAECFRDADALARELELTDPALLLRRRR